VPPSPEEQIGFLVNLQRLLDEGLFVASYKFALLLALADLSIEKGDDSGALLAVDATEIAEKFILLLAPGGAVPVATQRTSATAEYRQASGNRERGTRRSRGAHGFPDERN
jgi:hypothetical protein